MSAVATRPAPLAGLAGRIRDRASSPVLVPLGLLALMLVSVWLRTRALDAAYWIDEGISVGIGSYSFGDIPHVLRIDGSPPLWYLLLHLWMQAFGDAESATHTMSLLFTLVTIPVAYAAGRLVADRRTAWIAAVLVAMTPYLTYYAQETRMYALQALLSLVVATCFVRAFVVHDRRFLPPFAVALAAMLYTHNWAIFYGAGTVVALGVLWRLAGEEERRVLVRDALLVYGGVALLYLPWVPTLVWQARHTGAPWALRPGLDKMLEGLGFLLGGLTTGIVLGLVAGNGVAARVRDARDRRTVALVALLGGAVLAAFVASQLSPAFTNRYFASFFGALLLLVALGLRHSGRLGAVCLAIACVLWLNVGDVTSQLEHKSNVRSLSMSMAPLVTTGDLVVSTQPEQLPVIAYYMPKGVRYADALGPVRDPRVFDWTDCLQRLRDAHPTPTIDGLLRTMRSGQEVVLMQPILRTARWHAPWTSLVRRRSVQWERRLDADRRVRREAVVPVFGYDRLPRGARAVVYRVR